LYQLAESANKYQLLADSVAGKECLGDKEWTHRLYEKANKLF